MTAALALVSARAARALDADLPPLLAAFAAAGVRAEAVDWDDAQVEWQRFDAALLRSTWDYAERLSEFLDWVERAAARTRLLNPPALLRWNTDKHYLLERERAGVAVVASSFAEPGTDAAAALDGFLTRHGAAELVVKPAVGAGSRDARRHRRAERAEILAHMQQLLAARRSVLLQPYLAAVDHHGESALIFIGGRFSHSVRKGPLLPAGAPSTPALFAPEEISPRQAGADELALAQRALAALPGGAPLYARVDLIRDDGGAPRLLELELIEPSLFFAEAAGSAQHLAAATLATLAGQPDDNNVR